MTAPRQILPGSSYLVTRRCSERRFFLRPSAASRAILQFALAAVAERHGILLHAWCVLSNHLHIVLTDPLGRLPLFQRDLNSNVARATNRLLGRFEHFWAPDSYSAVRLETPGAILDKIVYVLANPVAAGLVRRAAEWPGLWSDPALFDAGPVAVERPREFFRVKGPLPTVAHLRLCPPPAFEGDAAFVETIRARLREEEERLLATRTSFLGVARVLAQKPFARPALREPRFGLRPRVAARDESRRVEALLRLAEFTRAYREALEAWRAGVRDVLFPEGTWQMRVEHRVRCAAPA